MGITNFDKQISRALELMDYRRTPINESYNPVEFYKMGANGKVYGIVREGSKFVIKTTVPGKETIAESYSYIGGVTQKKYNSFSSYNDATRHLELTLMGLNESMDKKLSTSTVDFNRNEKKLAELTQEARTELNRIHQLYENCCKIGKNPESEGCASASDTKKNNFPFELPAKAELHKDFKKQGTLKSASVGDEVSMEKAEQNLTSDKAPKGKSETVFNKPVKKSFKAMAIKEEEMYDDSEMLDADDALDVDPYQLPTEDEMEEIASNDVIIPSDSEEPLGFDDDSDDSYSEWDDADVTDAGEDDDLDSIIAELEGSDENPMVDSALDSLSSSELNECIEMITDAVYENLCEAYSPKRRRPVRESVTRLNDYGKHPRYQKPAFSTPANKEVITSRGHKDWNDESAKGEEPYGRRIGSSYPYTETNDIDSLVNMVVNEVKGVLKKK